MAKIKLDLFGPPTDGQDIKFRAPCDCTQIDGLLVAFPDGEQEYTFRDAHGHNLAGLGNLFAEGAYVKAILDTGRRYAYLQNADTNSFLHSAVFGTYTHEGENLAGHGENGKFKATTSGTISAINVNGVSCSVKCGDANSMDLIAGCWYTFILDGETVNFNAGGAGGGLNFKVVGGIEEPASPSDNTIWVVTDTPISGYAFSATEPAEPVEGMVWISVGTSSPVAFNALKKDSLQVYPISAKQHLSGAWEAVTAKSYQNGAWVAWWNGELYMEGKWFTVNTGKWVSLGKAKGSDSYAGKAPDIQENTDNFKLYYADSVNASGMYYLEDKIDLSDYTTLHFEGELNPYDGVEDRARVQIWRDIGQYTLTNVVAHLAKSGLSDGVGAIDVSALDGEYHIGFSLYSRSSDISTIICKKLYLTK